MMLADGFNNNNLFLAEIPNRIFLSLGMHQFYQYGFNFFFDYEERLVNHNQKKSYWNLLYNL